MNGMKVLISEEEIKKRIGEIAKKISADYKGKTVKLICVLKGGVMFLVDMARSLELTVEFDFMVVKSYVGTESTGKIEIVKDLEDPIEGENIILVEDIIDTGRTLSYLIEYLKAKNPASITVCTLLDKPERRVVDGVIPDYIGFVIPDEFVVGYGLDYNQKYRNLPYVATLS